MSNARRSARLDQYTVIRSTLTGGHLVQISIRPDDNPDEIIELTMPASAAEVFAAGVKASASQARTLNERAIEEDW
jgi:hypothetical protein